MGCGQNYICYTIYTLSYFILSSIALLLPCIPLCSFFFSCSYSVSPLLLFIPCTCLPLRSLISPRVLPDLASFSRSRLLAASISYTPPHRYQHPPIRHPARTYIAARNAESYSVSLDSLKQVLMSCTPTPRSSPTAYPLATEYSSRSLSATFHATVTL